MRHVNYIFYRVATRLEKSVNLGSLEKSGKFVRSQGKYESSKSQGKVRDFYSELRKCGDYFVTNCESNI